LAKSDPTQTPISPADQPRKPAPTLTGKQRRHLRALAHDLQPVVQIGKAGPSKTLLKELDRAIDAHELVKIRALRECPTELDEILTLVEQTLGASAVGSVGKVAVLYRARKKDPKIMLPAATTTTKTRKTKSARRNSES
jgi:RNA-binding protein